MSGREAQLGEAPIVCLAHGSRHPQAETVAEDLARAVGEFTGASAYAAHLDFSQHTLPAVAADIAATGATRAVVVPLLFTSAYHMRVDVPRELEQASHSSGLDLVLAECLGTGEDIAEILAHAHREAAGVENFVLYAVGSSVPGANDQVRRLAVAVGDLLRAARSTAIFATGPSPEFGPDAAIVSATRSTGDGPSTGYIAPLFVSPGRLWDQLLERMSQRAASPATKPDTNPETNPNVYSGMNPAPGTSEMASDLHTPGSRCLRVGTHLGEALAPLIARRAAAAIR